MNPKVEQYIKALLSAGFKETWIAKQAKVSQSTINRLKQKKVQSPRWETVEKILAIYRLHLSPPSSTRSSGHFY